MSAAARTRWGLHELSDNWARRLVAGAGVAPGDLVLDVGAGTGPLTGALLDAGATVIAVELHPGRAKALRSRFSNHRVVVVQADAADLRLPCRAFKVVANPPFAASAALPRRLVAPGSRLQSADVVLPAWVVRRWASADAPAAARWRQTFRARAGLRLPSRAFRPAAPGPTAVLRLQRHPVRDGGPNAPPCRVASLSRRDAPLVLCDAVDMATFILRLDDRGTGPRLAVKDLIDLEGVPTTAGSRALALSRGEKTAAADAPLMAGARAAGARVVGKTNLHELAIGPTGVNPWYGTPRNPLDAALIPGGSSSGSAVAVADEDADVAYGSDTGGSVRIPSACCGTAGLKTTFGRISVEGTWPLSPSLDTIGPMARDVAGLVLGMQLLEPGFSPADTAAATVGRIRLPGTDPAIDAALDGALHAAELEVVPVELPGWPAAVDAVTTILTSEAFAVNRELQGAHPEGISELASSILALGSMFTPQQVDEARAVQKRWKEELAGAFQRVEALALPTLVCFPPPVEGSEGLDTVIRLASATAVINLAGLPALSLPVPASGQAGLPASLQLVGPARGEEQILALGARIEEAVRP